MAKLEYRNVADNTYRAATGSNGAVDVNIAGASGAVTINVAEADLATIGAKADAVAADDTGVYSLAALAKRSLQRWTTFLGRFPAALGATTAANSLPVTLSTDGAFATNFGAVADAAATTDTGSFSLLAFVKRGLQNWTSLLAKLPASLGAKLSAASLSVVPATDAVWSTQDPSVTPTDRSGTITAGGTQQTAMAANAARKGFTIQNQSVADLWFNSLANAVQSQPSFRVPAGALYENPRGGCPTGVISIIGGTTGQAFTAREW